MVGDGVKVGRVDMGGFEHLRIIQDMVEATVGVALSLLALALKKIMNTRRVIINIPIPILEKILFSIIF